MICRYEHDGDCCNAGADQYMCKCKMPCETAWALTNGDVIRRMTNADLAEFIIDGSPGNEFFVDDNRCFSEVELLLWLEQWAK